MKLISFSAMGDDTPYLTRAEFNAWRRKEAARQTSRFVLGTIVSNLVGIAAGGAAIGAVGFLVSKKGGRR